MEKVPRMRSVFIPAYQQVGTDIVGHGKIELAMAGGFRSCCTPPEKPRSTRSQGLFRWLAP